MFQSSSSQSYSKPVVHSTHAGCSQAVRSRVIGFVHERAVPKLRVSSKSFSNLYLSSGTNCSSNNYDGDTPIRRIPMLKDMMLNYLVAELIMVQSFPAFAWSGYGCGLVLS